MANPTTNFGWVMPTSTDLVTDLPADFNVFGQAVDTSMADLKGGTTGQILSKATNTDMDFTWITNDVGDITAVTAGTGISGGGTSGAVTITNSMQTTITTAGDVLYGTGSAAVARLGIGTAGQVLTVAGGIPSWAAPATGGKVLQVQNFVYGTLQSSTSITFATTGITISITPTLATSNILVMVNVNGVSGTGELKLYRAGSNIASIAATSQVRGGNSLTYLDSPATTSATTYAVYFSALSGTYYINDYAGSNAITQSTITVMEIGA